MSPKDFLKTSNKLKLHYVKHQQVFPSLQSTIQSKMDSVYLLCKTEIASYINEQTQQH